MLPAVDRAVGLRQVDGMALAGGASVGGYPGRDQICNHDAPVLPDTWGSG